MKFPITVTQFDESSQRFCDDVDVINTQEEFEVAKAKWVPRFPYIYTFTDSTGTWVKL